MASTGYLYRYLFCLCWLLMLMASVVVKAEDSEDDDLCMLDKEAKVLTEAKCVPLRILTEQEVVTPVGELCVDFMDSSQTTMEVVYSTQGTNYTLVDLHLYAGPDVKRVPSNSLGMPSPEYFEYQLLFDEGVDNGDFQVKSLSFPTSRLGAMSCPSETDWTKYLVAHATVQQDDGEDINVYGHEGYLFKYTNAESAETDYYSYVQLNLSCQCQDGDDHSNIFAPNTNTTQDDPNSIIETQNPSTHTLVPSALVSTPSPSTSPTTAASTTSSPTEMTRMTPPPIPEDIPPPPPMRPVQNLAGEDLVVGMSFIVITDTSAEVKTELDRNEVQRGFSDFARNVLEEMQVFPLPRLASATGMRNDNNNGRRRQLWVKYDNSSIHVYTFLITTYCSPDDATSVIHQQTPPVRSQCHRAYARFGVRIVGEDLMRVCETLRNGTLLGYQQGMLQQAMLQAYPDTTIQLHPGDFEYCVPVADFVVPNHTAPYDIIVTNETDANATIDTSWTDSNPLANLTKVTVVEDTATEIPWILFAVIGIILFVSALSGLTLCYLQRRQQKQEEREEEDKLRNEEPPEIKALMT